MPYCANCGREISAMAASCPNCGHPGPAAPQSQIFGVAAAGPAGRPLAGWWQRVAAALVDGLIVFVPSYIVMILAGVGFAASGRIDARTGRLETGPGFVGGFVVAVLVILAIGVAYRVLLEGSDRGQTLGKMAMGIQVRDAQAGGPIGYGRAFLRWLVASTLWMFFYLPGLIDVLFPLWDPRRQTIHDKAAGSVVVRVA